MKCSLSSSQKATPVTPMKGVNRFQLGSNSSPSGDGLAGPFDHAPGMTSSSLAEPRLIDFTASLKSKASGNAGESAAIPVVDLTAEDEIDHVSALSKGATEEQTATPATPSTLRHLPQLQPPSAFHQARPRD